MYCVTRLPFIGITEINRNADLTAAIDSDSVNKIKEFLDCHRNINEFRFKRLMTALMYALETRRSNEVIHYLIDVGSDVNAECIDAKTPLIYALGENYDKSVISRLIDNGANVNHFFKDRTPLYFAVKYYKNPEIVSMLIDAGADVNVRNIIGRNVLRAIVCNDCNTFGNCENRSVINILVKSGIDLQATDKRGNTVLHWSDCCNLIDLAVRSGVSVNKKNFVELTPLISAVNSYNYDKVKTLLLLNADPNCTGFNLRNPLHFIRMPGSNKIFNLLVYHGTDVCARDVYNNTPLDLLLSESSGDDTELKEITMPFIKHCLLFLDGNLLNESFRILNNKSVVESLMKVCKSEINKMKTTYIKENLTFYEFCKLKQFYKNKFIVISINQYNYKYIEIKQLFPNYHDLIIMRMKDNYIKNCELVLQRSLEKIIMRPLSDGETRSNECLDYDCLYYICRYLNRKELYNLFLASIKS